MTTTKQKIKDLLRKEVKALNAKFSGDDSVGGVLKTIANEIRRGRKPKKARAS